MSAVQHVGAQHADYVQQAAQADVQQVPEESCSEKVQRVKEESFGCLLACFEYLGGSCCCFCPSPYPSERIYHTAGDGDLGGLNFWIWVNGDRAINMTAGYRMPGSALHAAVRRGYEDVVQVLVGQRIDVNQKNSDGDTALHVAVNNRDLPMVQILLEAGADVDLKNSSNYEVEYTPLERAAIIGDLGIVLVLMNANPDRAQQRAQTAIIIAAKNGHAGVVQNLFNEIGVVNASFDERLRVLHQVARAGDAGVVQVLVTTDRRLLNVRNFERKTVIQVAAERGRLEVLKVLLELVIDANDRVREWETALLSAVSNNRLDAVNALVDMDRNALRGSIGPRALSVAVNQGYTDIMSALLRFNEIDVNADVNGKTALHVAVQKESPYSVRALIEAGADVNAEVFHGSTPLRYVEFIHQVPVVSLVPRERHKWNEYYGRWDENQDPETYEETHAYPRSREREQIMRALIDAGADIKPLLDELNFTSRRPMKSLQILGELRTVLEQINKQGLDEQGFLENQTQVRSQLQLVPHNLFGQNDLLQMIMNYVGGTTILNGVLYLSPKEACEAVSYFIGQLDAKLSGKNLA